MSCGQGTLTDAEWLSHVTRQREELSFCAGWLEASRAMVTTDEGPDHRFGAALFLIGKWMRDHPVPGLTEQEWRESYSP